MKFNKWNLGFVLATMLVGMNGQVYADTGQAVEGTQYSPVAITSDAVADDAYALALKAINTFTAEQTMVVDAQITSGAIATENNKQAVVELVLNTKGGAFGLELTGCVVNNQDVANDLGLTTHGGAFGPDLTGYNTQLGLITKGGAFGPELAGCGVVAVGGAVLE